MHYNFLVFEGLQGTHMNALNPFNSKLITLIPQGNLETFSAILALCESHDENFDHLILLFNQPQHYSSKMCCDCLKTKQKVGISVVPLYNFTTVQLKEIICTSLYSVGNLGMCAFRQQF